MTRTSALAVALVLAVLPAAAEAQVVTLRPHPGPKLAQGPQLAGGQIAWSQEVCLEGCGDFPPSTRGLYEVRSANGAGPGRRLFRAGTAGASSGPNFGYSEFSFLLSPEGLVTVRLGVSGDELGGDHSEIAVRAGAPGTRRPLLVGCSGAFPRRTPPVAVDGGRVAFDPDPCDDLARLVVRDLASGNTVTLPEPAGGANLRLRGGYVAWIEGDGATARLVVHDLTTGTAAYSAPATGVLALDLDADGTVATVTGEWNRPCSTGRLLRYAVTAPAATDLGPACATGVSIEGGRIAFLHPDGFTRTLRVLASDGSTGDLVRFGRVRPAGFDFDGERLAWAARDCGGGEALFTARLAETPLEAGSINCRVRFGAGVVPVRRGVATVRLRCPRGCAGELRLRHMGRRDFSLPAGQRDVRIRLNRRARARLRRRGALEAHAFVETHNRAGDRQARRRAVMLVAR